MKHLLFLICFFALNLELYAQLSSTDKKAVKYYNEANEKFKDRDFTKGTQLLEKALNQDPNFFEAAYSLAVNFSMLGYKNDAETYYRKAAAIKPNSASAQEVYFMVAEYDFAKGDYKAAKIGFEKYLTFSPKNQKAVGIAKKKIANTAFAIEKMENPLNFSPKALNNNINTEKMQYFPIITADDEMMIFVRRKSFKREDDENLFVSYKKNGDWDVAMPLTDINTDRNEGTSTISADGKVLIFSACEGNPERPVLGSCDLFISYRTGDKWSKPQNMGVIVNSREWDSQPSLTADGRTLYFVSNRMGGMGMNDIWRTQKNSKGEWEKPVNLLRPINTSGDEIAPFIHASGKALYFASDFHPGLGGYDLFKSEIQKDNTWGTPQNMGYPINTFQHQVGLFVSADGKKGYYSVEENQGNVISSSIIHEFEMPKEAKNEVLTSYVKGIVYDAKTKQKINAKIELADLASKNIEAVVESDGVSGQYLFVINQGSEYALNISKKDYLFQSVAFDYKNRTDNESLTLDIYLEKIEKGNAVTLNNIFFETSKWDLLEKSATELNNIVLFLQNNADIKIEISGHTDNVGGKEANQKLSEMRAKSVSDYLVSKGVAANRIISKGYGETKPKVENNNDANKAINRRIEFKVL